MAGLLITVLAALGAWWFKHRSAGRRRRQEHDCGAPAAEHERRFQRGLSAFRAGRRNCQRADLFAQSGCAALSVTRKYVSPDLDPQQVGRELHVATCSDRALLETGRSSAGHAGSHGRKQRPAAMANQLHTFSQRFDCSAGESPHEVRQGLLPMLGAAAASWTPARGPKIRRPTIFICIVWPCPQIPHPIRMRSPCSNTS